MGLCFSAHRDPPPQHYPSGHYQPYPNYPLQNWPSNPRGTPQTYPPHRPHNHSGTGGFGPSPWQQDRGDGPDLASARRRAALIEAQAAQERRDRANTVNMHAMPSHLSMRRESYAFSDDASDD